MQQKNIFIVPTGAGVMFMLLLLLMLLTAINYQNSLIYLLTFVLGAVFVAAMYQTHRNLSGVAFTLVNCGEGFAGDTIAFTFRADAGRTDAIGMRLSHGKAVLAQQHLLAGESCDMTLMAPASRRGYLALDRVRVETRFPFGLLKAWSWLRPVSAATVYPRPVPAPDVSGGGGEPDNCEDALPDSGQDHAELRPWREGDLSQRVQWKRYARSGDMVIADWMAEGGSPHWLDFAAFTGADTELRLSYLADLVIQRSGQHPPFGLRLPGLTIDPDQSGEHTRRCLAALATYGLESPR
ncbi:DUF58 domain-containing protein [Marinobacter sp. X15-166B]|uniref:DUF58 domain-containing protein n=1 Tax=Marinobacter sp. X15-166B TaxID=1897620 RepID=UPI001D176160|nr:DUF58 domain-containing protein [Marinobacter sp. X15-166B]